MPPVRGPGQPCRTPAHLAAAATLLLLSGCAVTASPAPAPAASTPLVTPAPLGARLRSGYTEADARFMQEMIAHHRQALDMAALVPERTENQAIRLLAERIGVSQESEIARMQRWLERRGEMLPDAMTHVHHAAADHARMPGMLSVEAMTRLAAARGADFDRRFLEGMIEHHEGALGMVDALLAAPGAGQESELFQLASDVDADQRAEIARMRRILADAARAPNSR